MKDKADIETLTVDLPYDTATRHYEMRRDVRHHESFTYPRSAPRVPRNTEPCNLVAFIGIVLGVIVAFALFGYSSMWSIDKLSEWLGALVVSAINAGVR